MKYISILPSGYGHWKISMDLDYNDIPYIEVKHKGTSRENEKIYKLG